MDTSNLSHSDNNPALTFDYESLSLPPSEALKRSPGQKRALESESGEG